MMQNFATNLVEGFVQPRRSARRIIALGPDLRTCLLMVVLAYAIQAATVTLLGMASPGLPAGGGLAMRVQELVLQIALFFALTFGAHAIGARFGGTGTRDEVAAVVAWHALVTAFLAPFNVLGIGAATPEAHLPEAFILFAPFSVGVSIWLFAQYIAEAHRFTRIAPVIGATLLGFIVLGFVALLLSALLGGSGA